MSFTRASSARWKDSTLTIKTALTDAVRSEHYLNRFVRGTLLEPAGQNDYTKSEAMDDAAYTKSETTISANVIAAPDGQTTADKVVETTATGLHTVQRNTPATTDNTLQAFSFFAKAAERSVVVALASDKTGASLTVRVDLTNGAILQQTAGVEAYVEPYVSGWWRVMMQYDIASGGSTPICAVELDDGNGVSYTGDGSSGAYVWGWQFEIDKPWPTSYIPTDTIVVARAVDTLTLDFAAPAQTLTAYVDSVEVGGRYTVSGSKTRPVDVGDDGELSRFEVEHAASLLVRHTDTSGSSVTASSAVTPALGSTVEILAQSDYQGAVRMLRSIDGSALVGSSFSGALAYSTNFGLPGPLRIGSFNGTKTAPLLLRTVQLMRGVQDDIDAFRHRRRLTPLGGFGEQAFGAA